MHHEIEGALAASVAPIGVVQFARAVDAQADQEVVFLEEGAPVVVEQQAVGLESVLHRLAGPAVFLDQFDGALEELELHQRRLAALPGDGHLGRAMRFQQLADVGLERGLRHPVLVVRDTAPPWTGRSNRRSRCCKSTRSAWRAGGSPAASWPAEMHWAPSFHWAYKVALSFKTPPPSRH